MDGVSTVVIGAITGSAVRPLAGQRQRDCFALALILEAEHRIYGADEIG
jgi:hypothetical protein